MIAFNQPLFALVKKVQVSVPMMGPLCTEMASRALLGDILKDSGYTSITSNAQIARPGFAESLVSEHDFVRAKYTHQITTTTFDRLQYQAYKDSGSDLILND